MAHTTGSQQAHCLYIAPAVAYFKRLIQVMQESSTCTSSLHDDAEHEPDNALPTGDAPHDRLWI